MFRIALKKESVMKKTAKEIKIKAWKTALLSAFIWVLLPTTVRSETIFLVETDPATFALNGYSAHLRVKPANLKHWALGWGVYSLELPRAFVNFNPRNAREGWEVDMVFAHGPFFDYYFEDGRRGWFVGGQVAFQEFRVRNRQVSTVETTFDNLLIMPRVGYQWFPSESGFYVLPWLGVGYTTTLHGSKDLGGGDMGGGKSYDVSPLIYFATVHIGYEF